MTQRLETACAATDGGPQAVALHSLGLTRKTTTVQATPQSLPILVLDLVPTRAGEPAGRAIARSVELAWHVEQLGYKRYWVAEYHAIRGLVCSATPVLIGNIAAATKTIRVGSGGVMLPNHAPLMVAEQMLAEPQRMRFWKAEDLQGFPIKIEFVLRGERGPIIRYKNVVLGPQDPTLFVHPKSCQPLR